VRTKAIAKARLLASRKARVVKVRVQTVAAIAKARRAANNRVHHRIYLRMKRSNEPRSKCQPKLSDPNGRIEVHEEAETPLR
jgi:hypothetical protein